MDHAEALHLRRDSLTACDRATGGGGLLEAADVIRNTVTGVGSGGMQGI